jgi:mxaJ protein
MSSRCLSILVCMLLASAVGTRAEEPLRVCADPNNLPFSNDRGGGFENRIAALLAEDWGASLEYTWWAQRRGFIRNTLKAGVCDVVMGLPTGLELALTTKPYYRSTYVAVTRPGARQVRDLGDPALGKMRIGVQLIGDDFSNTPPAHALSRHGHVENVRGYTVYGDYRDDPPTAPIVAAVERGEIDVAFVWGPLAGFLAPPRGLAVTPLDDIEDGEVRLAFAIAMGVRRGDEARRDRLDDFLERRRDDIDGILAAYRVPRR